MKLTGEGTLLRIFIGEADQCGHRPLYDMIVVRAREAHLAGATVLRGVEGYGAASRIHTARILRLSEDLPVVIELVDSTEKIEAFLPVINALFDESGCGGMITEEKVRVIRYVAGAPQPG